MFNHAAVAIAYEGGNLEARTGPNSAATARFPLGPHAASRLIHAEIENPRTRARLIASAARILGNEADAEDCVQEALILASKNADQFEGRSSPTSWLFRVVLNSCRMQRRAARRERRGGGAVHVSMQDLLSSPAADGSYDPEEAVAATELVAVVDDELSKVAERDAALFRRYMAEDHPLETLARETHLTRQAVKSRLFRVRRRLSDRLVKEAVMVATA
jgi:RNA polymerase sigma-70 factor (ECF subfamily)